MDSGQLQNGDPNRFEIGDLACFLGDQNRAGLWYQPLLAGFREFGFTNARRQAMALAQMGQESGLFTVLEENLNYSVGRLMEVWPTRFCDYATAQKYAYNPEALANLVYGSRLGNRFVGDGWNFRGRGPIQITGRGMYEQAGLALKLPLVQKPELLLSPEHGSRASLWFLSRRYYVGINWLTWADWGNLTVCTRLVNGGTIGIEGRRALLARARQCLQMV